jgi:phosphotriesterase-related protein
MAEVRTVLGDVPAESVGKTLPHEHLLLDISVWADEEGKRDTMTRKRRADTAVTLGDLWWMGTDRAFGSECRDNWRLDDPELAVEEVERFARAGGDTLVDVTPMSPVVGRDPERIRDIAHETGLNVVAGTGHYVRGAHPPEVAEQSAEEIAATMTGDINSGMNDTDVRAGVIGEIGTSHGFLDHEGERKCVRAAAITQADTGASITLHPPFFYQEAHDVLDVLADAGADLGRVVVGHLDCSLRLEGAFEYYRSLAERGVYLQFDTFGRTGYHAAYDQSYPLDADRIGMLERLIEAGYGEQLLLSQDVCKKIHLTQYGGIGYDYILRDIVPRLRRRGFDAATIEGLLVRNPRDAISFAPGR